MQMQQAPQPAEAVAVALMPEPNRSMPARFLRVPLAIWRAMTMSRKVAVGSAIVGFFILVGLFGPVIIRTDPNSIS
ncbi:MAG TPA: hypothetical protein VGT82_17475, partial [Ktedonobacteraceae bacterium]|nr:hypothetical protein [Ktedonobacteraceae bacterium]